MNTVKQAYDAIKSLYEKLREKDKGMETDYFVSIPYILFSIR